MDVIITSSMNVHANESSFNKNNRKVLSEDKKMEKYEKQFDDAMEKIEKINETRLIEKTTLKEYSEKVRNLMVRRRIRKYGNLGSQ